MVKQNHSIISDIASLKSKRDVLLEEIQNLEMKESRLKATNEIEKKNRSRSEHPSSMKF